MTSQSIALLLLVCITTSAQICDESAISTAVAKNAAAVAPCTALITAANAGQNTEALKCPCFSKVSAAEVAPFDCKFKATDVEAVLTQWAKCQNGVCDQQKIAAAIANNAAAQAPCTALVTAANAGQDTEALKCPCYSKVSATEMVPFECKFKADDSETILSQWSKCTGSAPGGSPTKAPDTSAGTAQFASVLNAVLFTSLCVLFV